MIGGGGESVPGGKPLFRCGCHANANGQIWNNGRCGMGQVESGNGLAHRLRNMRGIGSACFREDDGELLTADARNYIDLTPRSFEELDSQLDEVFIAAHVALRIIQHFELIYVDGEQREAGPGSSAAGTLLIEGLVKGAAVGQTGERIGEGEARQFFVGAAQIGGFLFNQPDQLAFPVFSANETQPQESRHHRERNENAQADKPPRGIPGGEDAKWEDSAAVAPVAVTFARIDFELVFSRSEAGELEFALGGLSPV